MITLVTCTKLFADIPFAHRQHLHDGHCAFIHGHNWSIQVTFEAERPDINGFVVDFGKLKYLERWIDEVLDHACLINKDDEEGKRLVLSNPDLFKFVILDDVSCEGLAKFVCEEFNAMVQEHTNGRVRVREVTIFEDSKNSATYRPDR